MIRYPNRHRLYGGRNTHATAPAPGFPYGVTACGRPITEHDEPQDDDAAVNCRACIREMNR